MKLVIEIEVGELSPNDSKKCLAVSQLVGDVCFAEIVKAASNVGTAYAVEDDVSGLKGTYSVVAGSVAASGETKEDAPEPPRAEPPKPEKKTVEEILAEYFKING